MSHTLICVTDCVLVTHSSSLLRNILVYLNIAQFIDGCWSYFQYYVFTNNAATHIFVRVSSTKAEPLCCYADHFGHECIMDVPGKVCLLPSDWLGQGLG